MMRAHSVSILLGVPLSAVPVVHNACGAASFGDSAISGNVTRCTNVNSACGPRQFWRRI